MTELVHPVPRSRRLEVRQASGSEDIAAAQRLRWRVFYEEMGATPTSGATEQLDSDVYDPLCDHLLVIDHDAPAGEQVVGTYRLLRESVASSSFGFYTAGEFDIAMLSAGAEGGELLELGRSCVLPAYRTSATIQLLWRAIGEYIAVHRIRMMFGCASFAGTDPSVHAAALSYLQHHHLAAPELRPVVAPGKGVAIEPLAAGSYNERRAFMSLPPLLKGYLRIGASVGEGAFIDHQFNTIDVCVVMPVNLIADHYAARFQVAA